MNPPIVYELTIPSIHRMSNTANSVMSIGAPPPQAPGREDARKNIKRHAKRRGRGRQSELAGHRGKSANRAGGSTFFHSAGAGGRTVGGSPTSLGLVV